MSGDDRATTATPRWAAPDQYCGYWVGQTVVVLSLFAIAVTAFVLIGNSWWQLALASYFALLSTRLAVLGHDVGHSRIFPSPRANYLLGVSLTNVGVGFSFDWWASRPTRHPAGPDDADDDPDVGILGLISAAWIAQLSRLPAGTRHHHRAWTALPLLLLEAVKAHFAGARHLVNSHTRQRLRELPLIGLHLVAYFGGIFLVLPAGKGLTFIAVHQGLFGLYLSCMFVLSYQSTAGATREQAYSSD
ncbi:hypothetical protein ACQP2Y_11360 [Actinoplanes sp. CA-051413]|uniref:hypothetical protein n=1 Tax=Actinoplanes sp. CA-051413 TaxID=3239899 RepID=UPI003D96C915